MSRYGQGESYLHIIARHFFESGAVNQYCPKDLKLQQSDILSCFVISRHMPLDGKLSFTFHKIQAYSITKGIFYPSFFIMKLFDKTTEYCQCD